MKTYVNLIKRWLQHQLGRNPLRNRRFWGGFGAQLAGSESPSKSSILGGFGGPISWVGIHFEIVDFVGFWGPACCRFRRLDNQKPQNLYKRTVHSVGRKRRSGQRPTLGTSRPLTDVASNPQTSKTISPGVLGAASM